ncbi:MAG TPA: DUF58 domain-containing protein [Gemmataceae bacterium]|nr:DUF58 domain-containing protein [Gemmataceae bacterium]
MIPLPSRRLVLWGAAVAVASLGALVYPGAALLVLTVDLLLGAAALLDWLITPGAEALDATRITPDRLSVLSPCSVAVLIRNRSSVPLHVRIRDSVPDTFTTETEELTGIVPASGEQRWEFRVKPRTRGSFSWGAIHVRYRSLLGLWERQESVAAAEQSRVYPNLVNLERYHLLARANRLEMLGIRKVRVRGNWEFESLREYVDGDDLRLIDWKATSRRSKMIVRNQEAERNQTVLLLVDSGRLMNAETAGASKLDHAVNTALMLAYVALARGDRVGLCTFSHDVHAWVVPRVHRAQIRLITEALYDLRGDFTETDHGRCLRLLAARFPKRALLIVLTDFVDAQTAADMIAHLHLAARRHLVLFAALKDPLLEQAARSHPVDAFEGFRKTAAVELLHERREVLERLRQMGAQVLDAEPSRLTPPLINRYLEITLRGLL